jgi:hypothetical protein
MTSIIRTLKPFMLNEITLKKYYNTTPILKCAIRKIKKENKEIQDVFIPKYKDTLFWCFYIITKGWEEFYLIGKKSFSIEKKYKISCIEQLRTQKELLKKNKWKRNEIESDLLNNKTLSTITFICLCALYDINVILIEDYYYYSYIINPSGSTFYIKKNKGRYGLYIGDTAIIIKELEKMWEIQNLKKPLRGQSSYKVNELKTICKLIDIDIYKDKRIYNKQDIYKLIKTKLNKDFLY